MACMAMVPFSGIVQKIEAPKYLAIEINEVEEMKEISSHVMLKISERELSDRYALTDP